MSDETLMTGGQDTNDTTGQSSADAVTTTQDAQAAAAGDASQEAQDGQQAETQDEAKPEGAPESYADFTLPEGVELESETLDGVKALAKELNLPQDKAQKVADLTAAAWQRKQEAFTKAKEQWANDTKADKEIGGQALGENLGVAKKALDAFGSDELKAVLNGSGLGNHPAVIKAFVKIGKAISEDKFVTGKAPDNAPADPAKRMYPNMN